MLFSRIRAFKNQSKIHQKLMQNAHRKMTAKKNVKKWVWDGLGLHLGRLWAGLGTLWAARGRLLERPGALWGPCWALLGRPWGALGAFFALRARFWRDFGRIWKVLEGFPNCSILLGGFCEGFWSLTVRTFWLNLKKVFARVCGTFHGFSMSGPPRCLASPREASQ